VNRYTSVKIALAIIAVGVWGYGARVDDGRFRLAGMIILGVAFVLRFLPRDVRERLDGRADAGARGPTDTHL
jgi:hypothetical protein